MTRRTLSYIALLISLFCFVAAFLITAHVLHGGDYHPWVDGGFIALVASLVLDRKP